QSGRFHIGSATLIRGVRHTLLKSHLTLCLGVIEGHRLISGLLTIDHSVELLLSIKSLAGISKAEIHLIGFLNTFQSLISGISGSSATGESLTRFRVKEITDKRTGAGK